MKKLYTLASAMSGKQEELNGKVFFIKKVRPFPGDYEIIQLIDVISHEVIWQTSAIKNVQKGEIGIKITTQNSTYDFIDVLTLIPTSSFLQKVIEEDQNLRIISEVEIGRKMINYGDGYIKKKISFNRQTSEEEIREFLKNQERVYKKKDQVAWWEKYLDLISINDNDTEWEATIWDRYTD